MLLTWILHQTVRKHHHHNFTLYPQDQAEGLQVPEQVDKSEQVWVFTVLIGWRECPGLEKMEISRGKEKNTPLELGGHQTTYRPQQLLVPQCLLNFRCWYARSFHIKQELNKSNLQSGALEYLRITRS